MDLFTLAATLTLDTSKYTQGIKDAEGQGSKLSQSLGKITTALKTIAGAAALGSTVKQLKSLADAAAEAGDKIDKQSQVLGISRKAYQEWDYILSQNGSSIDSLGTSMKTLNTSLQSGKDSVTKLGLSYADLNKMNMEQRFEAVVKAFQDMPEGAEKSALAVELFGRNGMELLPLLNSTSGSVEDLKKKFADLGIEMSDNQIDAAVRYTDSMDTLTRTFDGIKYAIGAELLPTMTEWADKAASYAGKLLKAYREDGLMGVFKTLDKDISTMTDNMKKSGNPVLSALADIIDGIKNGVKLAIDLFNDFPGTVKKLKESDSKALQVLGTALEFIQGIFNWIMDNQQMVVMAIGAIIAAFAISKIISIVSNLNPIVLIIEAIALGAKLVVDNWDGIVKFFSGVWDSVKKAATNAWTAISKWWQDNVTDPIVKAWEAIGKWFEKTVWDPIKEATKNAWNAVSTWWEDKKKDISAAWNTVGTWFVDTVWTPISDAATSAWGTISKWWEDNVTNPLKKAWKPVSDWFSKNVTKPIGDLFNGAFGIISQIWDGITTSISDAWSQVEGILTPIIDPIKTMFQGVSDVVSGIWDFLSSIFGLGDKEITVTTTYVENGTPPADAPSGAAITVVEGGGGAADSANTALINAKGDWYVPYDNYPALLHRGEMVLTKSQASHFRDGGGLGGGFDQNALATVIENAIREGMANAQVNSFIDGRKITEEVNRITGNSLMARRYAP